jgi:restriction system protein
LVNPEELDDSDDDKPVIVLPAQVISPRGPVPEGELIEVVAVPWLAICDELKRDPKFLYQFVNHPRNFEEFIAGTYERAGYKEVVLTPRSGDMGRDVIATKSGHLSVRILDQCKAYSPHHKVTANDVRAMLGVITADQNTSKGVVTTTGRFAPELAEDPLLQHYVPHRLELRDGKRLLEWLSAVRAKSGI